MFSRIRRVIGSNHTSTKFRFSRLAGRGQSMVEFALLATVGLMVLLVGVQFALIGQAALAISQGAYIGARYASVSSAASQDIIKTYVVSNGSPTITSNTNNLTVTADYDHSAGAATVCPSMTTRLFGCQVTVTLTFNSSGLIVLPNPFLGISFPTSLTATQSAMTE
jgi:Flp pilus assembly protein TadG